MKNENRGKKIENRDSWKSNGWREKETRFTQLFFVSTELIRKRVNRKDLLVSNLKGSGQVSSLLNIEPQIVEVLIQMSCTSESLTLSRAIAFINDI